MMRAAIRWSAGKDSPLALLHACAAGPQGSRVLTLCEPDGQRVLHRPGMAPPLALAAPP